MILNYKIKRKSLVEALDEIQAFEEKMEVLIEKYPNYSYNLEIEKETTTDPKWVVDLKIIRDEQRKINQSTEWNKEAPEVS